MQLAQVLTACMLVCVRCASARMRVCVCVCPHYKPYNELAFDSVC